MAHSTLHFAVGMALGTAVSLPPLIADWTRRRPLAPRFARWFVVSYATGTYAVIPAILRQLGVHDAICDGPWMNVFLLYPWMNAVKPGAVTSGPLALGALLGFQYLLLILAIAWTRHRPQATED
ncbi:MAG: hypothetical protein K8T26_07055 [Lentisphaerae bacterium]|nr:hypothetical protein [Lentisphaerota bacterium]